MVNRELVHGFNIPSGNDLFSQYNGSHPFQRPEVRAFFFESIVRVPGEPVSLFMNGGSRLEKLTGLGRYGTNA